MSEVLTVAYHFVGSTLRDGRYVPLDGEWLEHDGPLEMCSHGLHASLHPFDALQYAPGPTLCLVELGERIVTDTDKVVSNRRRIVRRFDATDLLRAFARQCALDVIHLWDAPEIVRRYLETGDESIRAAAWAAARAAARAAAWAAAGDAAWAAARAAARAAAGAAAWAAAGAAAGDAAGAAARAAAWAAAGDAAWAAAGDAAWAAARDAAWAAARDAQRTRFADLVNAKFAEGA